VLSIGNSMSPPLNAFWASLSTVLICAACAGQPAPSRPLLSAHWGKFDVFDDSPLTSYGIEYRFRTENPLHIVPAVGGTLVRDDANFFYADLRCELWFDDHWSISPRAGLGVFQESVDIDLGAPLEFRTGIELEHRLNNGMRIGLGLFHISNASLGRSNPGTEALLLSFSVPLGG
jgi:hypothetical protein